MQMFSKMILDLKLNLESRPPAASSGTRVESLSVSLHMLSSAALSNSKEKSLFAASTNDTSSRCGLERHTVQCILGVVDVLFVCKRALLPCFSTPLEHL